MRTVLARKGRAALVLTRELLFPLGCAACGEPLFTAAEAERALCRACAPQFNEETEERCEQCGRPLVSEFRVCIPCRTREEPFAFDGALPLYPYAGRYRTLLSAYKFGKHRPLARFFAEKLVSQTRGGLLAQEARLQNAVWTPVPPRAGKIKEAGWDQVEALARILEREHALPVRRLLRRLASHSQKTLGRAGRLSNLKGRIIANGPTPPAVILFDDVFTTGATLHTCAQALKAAGTQYVFALALFYD